MFTITFFSLGCNINFSNQIKSTKHISNSQTCNNLNVYKKEYSINKHIGKYVKNIKNLLKTGFFLWEASNLNISKANEIETPTFLKLFDNGYGYSVIETSDHNLAISGQISSYMLISKHDSMGNPLWSREYGSYYSNFGNSIIETKDKSLIVTGSIRKPISTFDSNFAIVEHDINGNFTWGKLDGWPGFNKDDYIWSGIMSSDQNLITVGDTDQVGTYGSAILSKRHSTNGTCIWNKVIEGLLTSRSVVEMKNGDIAMSTWSPISIVVFTKDGNYSWAIKLADTQNAYSIIQAENEDLIVAGDAIYTYSPYEDIFVGRINKNGLYLWGLVLSNTKGSSAKAIIESKFNQDLILIANTYNNTDTDILVSRITSNGTLLWAKLLKGPGKEFAYSGV